MCARTRGGKLLTAAAVIAILAAAGSVLFIMTGYKADAYALEMLASTDAVRVRQTDYGWMFDGPGDNDVLIFYPGARVDPVSYAPLLHELADAGMDVCLVDMPLDFAIFGKNKADEVIPLYDYENFYIGGHSLGGAMAAFYASEHPGTLDGIILLGAYSPVPLDPDMTEVIVVGSDDQVINWDKFQEGRQYDTSFCTVEIIEGGNHAGFGCYGEQRGDGPASITQQEQIDQTVNIVLNAI